jgi:DNA polymerase-3 subunit epsilon
MEPEGPLTDYPLKDATFIAFDTETTGLYPVESKLVEIGAVCFRLDGEEIAVFEQLINPGTSIPAEAQAVNHITDEMVSSKPPVERVLPAFLDFLGEPGNILIAHNAPFDIGFIGLDLIRTGLSLPRNAVFDTIWIAQAVAPGLPSYSLAALSAMLGVSGAQDHRALSDARLTGEVFRQLVGRATGVTTVGALAAIAPPQPFKPVRDQRARPPAGYEAIDRAISRGATVEIIYMGGTRGEEPRVVTPRGFVRIGNIVYLSGVCGHDGRKKNYRLDRIRSFRVL